MTLCDRQRAYYYEKLDKDFPGLRREYENRFGNQYFAQARNLPKLETHFRGLCWELNMPIAIPQFASQKNQQLRLF
jgi:hypothetical protein